jgi:hypothetical protein
MTEDVAAEQVAAAEAKPGVVRRTGSLFVRFLVGLAFLLVWLWTFGALYYMTGGGRTWLSSAVVVAGLIGTGAARFRSRKAAWGFLVVGTAVGAVWYVTVQPSNDRKWRPEVARMPTAEFDGDRVMIRNVRNFSYRSEDDFDVAYYDREYDLNQLETGDVMLVYWDGNRAIAHTMLSFGFANGDYVCLSVECRRETGEDWGGIPGIYKQFEVLYILADERDLVNLRTSYRGEDVYLYRLNLTAADIRTYFEHVLVGCNTLAERPRFYGTLDYNCHSSLTQLAKHLWPDRRRVTGWRALLNGYADQEMYARDRLVSGGLSFAELRERAYVTPLGRELKDDPDYSRKIRAQLP